MTVGGVTQVVFRKKQIPSCVGKFECKCFDELSNYNGSFDNMSDYTKRVKLQLEYFLYIVQIHVNKEELIETPEFTKIKGFVVRNVLYCADITRIHFESQIRIHGNSKVQLPSRAIRLLDFLKCFEKLFHAWDLSLELFFTPESELPMTSLQTVLESHHELIQVFEKYNQFVYNGHSTTITSFYGIQNFYHLFY